MLLSLGIPLLGVAIDESVPMQFPNPPLLLFMELSNNIALPAFEEGHKFKGGSRGLCGLISAILFMVTCCEGRAGDSPIPHPILCVAGLSVSERIAPSSKHSDRVFTKLGVLLSNGLLYMSGLLSSLIC